jgi:hypothetical protein
MHCELKNLGENKKKSYKKEYNLNTNQKFFFQSSLMKTDKAIPVFVATQ